MTTEVEYLISRAALAGTGGGVSYTFAHSVDLAGQIGTLCGAAVAVAAFVELVWRKAIRPFCVWRGWLKPLKRRQQDKEARDE